MTYAIRYYQNRWLARADWLPPHEADAAARKGWRPFIWVRDMARAEKFSSREGAELFLRGLPTTAIAQPEIVPLGATPKDEDDCA